MRTYGDVERGANWVTLLGMLHLCFFLLNSSAVLWYWSTAVSQRSGARPASGYWALCEQPYGRFGRIQEIDWDEGLFS